MIEYIINGPQTICIYKVEKHHFVGKSKQNPIDKYDEEKGKKVARIRAILKYKQWKLTNIQKEVKELAKAKDKYFERSQAALKVESKIWDLQNELLCL